jgi:hypothetical protein
VGSGFDDSTVLEYEDVVGIADVCQSVRDQDGCARRAVTAVRPLVEVREQARLGLSVEAGARFVGDEYVRVAIETAGDSDTLPLTDRKILAVLKSLG